MLAASWNHKKLPLMDDFSSQIRFPTPNCWHRFWWFQLVDPMSNSSKKVKKSSNCWHRFWWFQLVALSKMVPTIWWFFHFFWWFLFGKIKFFGSFFLRLGISETSFWSKNVLPISNPLYWDLFLNSFKCGKLFKTLTFWAKNVLRSDLQLFVLRLLF